MRRLFSFIVQRQKVLREANALRTTGLRISAAGSSTQDATGYPSWMWGAGAVVGSLALMEAAHMERLEGADSDLPQNPAKGMGWSLLDPATKRKTFYNYERRIRDLSQQDKIFHYFASKTLPDGSKVMTADDLICAVIAVFPPEASESVRLGGLAGEAQKPVAKKQRLSGSHIPAEGTYLAAFDPDMNGISYPEYILLLTFLKFPAQDVTTIFNMFDKDMSGKIDQNEFEDVVNALQSKLRKSVSVQRTGGDLRMKDSSSGLKERFFGPKGDKLLCLKDFAAFIEGMHEEMLRLEFEHYDIDQDETILGIDFARSILSAIELSKIDLYLERAENLPEKLKKTRVTYQQFRQFAMLYQHVHTLAVALDFFHQTQGKLDRADFKRATRIVTGSDISDDMVEIVYGLFDLDDDGSLSSTELIAVLWKREGSKASRRADENDRSQSLFTCLYNCAFQDR